jgi:hypothetical protein
MRVATVNYIVRSYLNQSKKPIHYYARFAKYASDCLRELLFDTLHITNTVRIPVNSFYEADVPEDCVDIIRVGVQAGQFVRPLVSKNTINNLPNIDSAGGQTTYPTTIPDDDWSNLFQWFGVNINSNGENTGGYFGLGAGSEPDTFKYLPERGVIQLNQNIEQTKIVLEYIGDGSSTNTATRVPVYAIKTIEAYISWQHKEHSKSFGAMDAERAKKYFDRQHEILRARKNNLTPELLERIINRSRKASIK